MPNFLLINFDIFMIQYCLAKAMIQVIKLILSYTGNLIIKVEGLPHKRLREREKRERQRKRQRQSDRQADRHLMCPRLLSDVSPRCPL